MTVPIVGGEKPRPPLSIGDARRRGQTAERDESLIIAVRGELDLYKTNRERYLQEGEQGVVEENEDEPAGKKRS